MKLRCLIVDDEPVARKGLAEDVMATGLFEVSGLAENAQQAGKLLASAGADLILVDIKMPGMNGLDFIRSLVNPPMVIITTAYPEYALKGYDLDVIDYLVKPIAFSRLEKACRKASEFYDLKKRALEHRAPADDAIFIKYNGIRERILLDQLIFIEGADNYITLHTTNKNYLIYQTLKGIQALLPSDDFFKIHKSFIIALQQVQSVSGTFVVIAGKNLPVSRNYRKDLMTKLNLLKKSGSGL